jgi:hypothetical protein
MGSRSDEAEPSPGVTPQMARHRLRSGWPSLLAFVVVVVVVSMAQLRSRPGGIILLGEEKGGGGGGGGSKASRVITSSILKVFILSFLMFRKVTALIINIIHLMKSDSIQPSSS